MKFHWGMSSTPRSAPGKMRRPQSCRKFPFAQQRSKSDLGSHKSNAGGCDRKTQPERAYVTKCIAEVHDLLKQLPRDVRFEVITKDFSQQQRLLLEKWMGETVEKPASPPVPRDIRSASRDAKGFPGSARMKFQTRDAHRRGRESAKAGHKCKSGHAGIQRSGRGYRAAVYFETVIISSEGTNLPTALEYLMLLTSAKQKMLSGHSEDAFEDRLEKSLMSASMEQGKSYETLTLYFEVWQRLSILIGPKSMWKSPKVQSCEQLKTLRRCMEPLRKAFNSSNFRLKNSFERFSPQEVGDLWEKFQKLAAEAYQIEGQQADSHLRRLNTWHTKTAPMRDRLLQDWERRHMCGEDHEYYKPRKWRYCPPIALKPKNPLVALKQLLVRWRHWLQQERLRSQAKRSQGLRRRRNQEHVQKRPKKNGHVIWMLFFHVLSCFYCPTLLESTVFESNQWSNMTIRLNKQLQYWASSRGAGIKVVESLESHITSLHLPTLPAACLACRRTWASPPRRALHLGRTLLEFLGLDTWKKHYMQMSQMRCFFASAWEHNDPNACKVATKAACESLTASTLFAGNTCEMLWNIPNIHIGISWNISCWQNPSPNSRNASTIINVDGVIAARTLRISSAS